MNNHAKEHILTCEDLSVGYKGKTVLDNLNFVFETGQFISLLGPNGAGKTTLLRTLSRHLAPLGGTIRVLGKPLQELLPMELAKAMAVVLTEKVSPPLFTVFEFVALGRYPHTDFLGRLGPEDHLKVQKALSTVHADSLAGRSFSDLSDGERQKALVARALAQEPRVLLLDEPTLHLDLKHRMEVMTILRNLCRSQGITVVASLHDVDVASKVSDQVALIKNGGILAWGVPEKVLTDSTVTDLYDFNDAAFSNHLGGIELRGNACCGRAFVVAGMGSGAMVYRMLSKRGFAIATGVLHTNDLDYYVAKSLGAECMTLSPMQEVNALKVSEAIKCLKSCDLVIDCGFDIGPMNQENMEIIKSAISQGKQVLSLRNNGTNALGNKSTGQSLIHCSDPAELIKELEGQSCLSNPPKQPEQTKEAV
jgi:iron complex transport system ATP-binding protein